MWKHMKRFKQSNEELKSRDKECMIFALDDFFGNYKGNKVNLIFRYEVRDKRDDKTIKSMIVISGNDDTMFVKDFKDRGDARQCFQKYKNKYSEHIGVTIKELLQDKFEMF